MWCRKSLETALSGAAPDGANQQTGVVEQMGMRLAEMLDGREVELEFASFDYLLTCIVRFVCSGLQAASGDWRHDGYSAPGAGLEVRVGVC